MATKQVNQSPSPKAPEAKTLAKIIGVPGDIMIALPCIVSQAHPMQRINDGRLTLRQGKALRNLFTGFAESGRLSMGKPMNNALDAVRGVLDVAADEMGLPAERF